MENKNDKNEATSFNVIEERAKVDKKVIEKGKVRITKKVETEEEKVKVVVKNEEINIERIAINEYADETPEIRQSGDTMIIPVIKEVAVVQKKIFVIEEIRVTKKTHHTEEERTVQLQKEKVNIETSRRKE